MTDEVKPDIKPDVEKLQLTVRYGDQSIKVSVKPTKQLARVFEVAADNFNLQANSVRFVYDGKRLQKEDTPLEHEMEDGDVIDANLEQIGGGN